MDLRKIIFVCGMLMLIKGVRSGEYRVSEFPCYGDVCNLRNASQFCSETFKLCRDCEEIKDDCETLTQPRECNSYCIELAVRSALAKKEINVCRVVPVMMNIDNGKVHAPSRNGDYFDVGSKITYSCNEGYEIQGYNELVCLEKGQWSQSAMPHCFDNRWKNYKYATKWLSIFVGALIAALICLICLICMFMRHKRRELQKLSRNSSQQPMQDEEQPFISDMPPETEQLRQPFNIGDDPLTEQLRQPFNIGDTPLTEQSYLNEEDDKINVRADQAESHEANGLRKDQPGQLNVVVNVINNAAQSPETKTVSENKSTDTHSDQHTMKNERRDEKLPTEESGETHPLKETAEGKACKGTKPLPARDEEPEQLKESFEVKGTDSPEVVPAEDEETQLSRNETDQRQTFKKVGMQDRTFAKGDIKYDRDKNRRVTKC